MKYLILLLLLISLNVFSQSFNVKQDPAWYKKIDGYIISNSNDTIWGIIFTKTRLKNQRHITFYKDSIKQTYFPFDINGYGFNNIAYMSVKQNRDIPKSMFLQRLNDDYLRIYNYSFRMWGMAYPIPYTYVRTIYYIQKGVDASIIHPANGQLFKNGLSEYLLDYPKLSEAIKNKQYKYRDLKIIVREYNEWNNKKQNLLTNGDVEQELAKDIVDSTLALTEEPLEMYYSRLMKEFESNKNIIEKRLVNVDNMNQFVKRRGIKIRSNRFDGNWFKVGVWHYYYRGSNVIRRTESYNILGRKHGDFIEYNEKGEIVSKLTFDDGAKQ